MIPEYLIKERGVMCEKWYNKHIDVVIGFLFP